MNVFNIRLCLTVSILMLSNSGFGAGRPKGENYIFNWAYDPGNPFESKPTPQECTTAIQFMNSAEQTFSSVNDREFDKIIIALQSGEFLTNDLSYYSCEGYEDAKCVLHTKVTFYSALISRDSKNTFEAVDIFRDTYDSNAAKICVSKSNNITICKKYTFSGSFPQFEKVDAPSPLINDKHYRKVKVKTDSLGSLASFKLTGQTDVIRMTDSASTNGSMANCSKLNNEIKCMQNPICTTMPDVAGTSVNSGPNGGATIPTK